MANFLPTLLLKFIIALLRLFIELFRENLLPTKVSFQFRSLFRVEPRILILEVANMSFLSTSMFCSNNCRLFEIIIIFVNVNVNIFLNVVP